MIEYTCNQCKDDVPFIYKGGICSKCYQAEGNILNVGEWAAEMKAAYPDNPKAWND